MAAMADGADDEDVLRRIALAPPPSVEARRELQQWMEKNHHGRPWKTTTTGGPRRRFFRLQGFKLEYFSSRVGRAALRLLRSAERAHAWRRDRQGRATGRG